MNEPTQSPSSSLEVLNRNFLVNHPRDAARKIETMPGDESVPILNPQPVAVLKPVWEYLAPGVSDRLLLRLERNKSLDLLVAMEPGLSAAILSRLEPEDRDSLLAEMDPGIARDLKELLDYPEDCAGRLMDTRLVALDSRVTVADAIAVLKSHKSQALGGIYLVDDQMRLTAQVDMQRLALAEPLDPLYSLSHPVKAMATVLDPRDQVIDMLQKVRVPELPVIDGSDRLLGVIKSTNLIDSLNETVSTDLQTMVGASKDERALSPAWFTIKKRQPWLQVNLVTAFLAAAVVGMFEATIAKYTALAILLPIAAGQSGNTGAQALAVTMRGLTLREITVHHWFRVTLKELTAAVVNGIAIAITCGAGVFIWSRSTGLALIIALAMVSSMTIAAISGALVPIVLKKLGQDPALSSSIILTTITDIAGFMSFLGIAASLSFMLD